MKEKWWVLALLLWVAGNASAKAARIKPESQWNQAVVQIGGEYQKNIQPIFKVSCWNCHSTATRYPWYYFIPGVKGMIDQDVTQARKHLDMSKGYPFEGPGSLENELKEIAYQVGHGAMPPFRYRVMHRQERLSSEQKQEIEDWTQKSLDRLYQAQP